MPNTSQADVGQKIQRLLLTDCLPNLVPLAAIVPGGYRFSYATDSKGCLTGLKLGLFSRRRTRDEHNPIFLTINFFNWLYNQITIKRLVLVARSIELPPGISKLAQLDYLYISGFARIPAEILDLSGTISRPEWARSGIAGSNHPLIIDSDVFMGGDDSARAEEKRMVQWMNPKLTAEALDIRGIFIDQCVEPPIELIDRGREALKTFFNASKGGVKLLNEAKMLLIGHGGAGKTSLLKALLKEPHNPAESQTHGINIQQLTHNTSAGEALTVNAWDFGGQEIMHSTHQFFLSKRSVYILVLDGRKDEHAEYWLKHVEAFGGTSPIVVAINKSDENPGFDVNRRFLKEKYPGIVGFIQISCANGSGIKEFGRLLSDALELVEIRQTPWPVEWSMIRDVLETGRNPFVSSSDFEKICESCAVVDRATQKALALFLSDLGVMVHFPDFGLEHLHVLNPLWLTNAVYKIINSQELAAGEGVLSLSGLSDLLTFEESDIESKVESDSVESDSVESDSVESDSVEPDSPKFGYPLDTHQYITEVMKKFELCYRLPDLDAILIPELLPVGQPDFFFPDSDCSTIIYQYNDFVPPSMLPRLVVRMNDQIEGGLRWRTGVVLTDHIGGNRGQVRVDYQDRTLTITVHGASRRDYLSVLRSEVSHLHRKFDRLPFREVIPLPRDPGVFTSYKHLTTLEARGEVSFLPDGASEDYSIAELLGTVRVSQTRSEEDFIRLLKLAIAETDDEKSAGEIAKEILILQPNFAGIGIDLKALVKKVFRTRVRDSKTEASAARGSNVLSETTVVK